MSMQTPRMVNTGGAPEEPAVSSGSVKSDSRMAKDEVALELMKFIAVTTGYGKGAVSTGFAGRASRTTDEQVDALIQLYERCRDVVNK